MKTVARCSMCLLKLAHTAADAVDAPEDKRMKAVRAALSVLAADDFSRTPPAIAHDILEAINEALGVSDPFERLKAEHDRKAMELARAWAVEFIGGAADPEGRLARAVRTALVGNGMDLATLPDQADPEQFQRWIETPFAIHHWDQFRAELEAAPDVLYLCDNAGEIAFDAYLIEELLRRDKKVTVSVKGGPALNDATIEDARLVGIPDLTGPSGRPRLITTGQAVMGVDVTTTSEEWRAEFERASLVIAKGQANLESLHDAGRPIYFLSLIKCTHVADHYGLPKGAAMLYRGGLESGAD